jgi:3-dehydroquinate synthase
MIKTAVIGDRELFELIEKHYREIMDRDCELLTLLVGKSVKFKAAVVTEDEKETGLRRILNFGHTFGHAIEMQTMIKHGFAVAAGMELATAFSFEKGMIDHNSKDRIINMLGTFGLRHMYDIPSDQVERLVLHDKKKTGSGIHFIFTAGIGKAVAEKISIVEVIDFYKRFRDKK